MVEVPHLKVTSLSVLTNCLLRAHFLSRLATPFTQISDPSSEDSPAIFSLLHLPKAPLASHHYILTTLSLPISSHALHTT